MDYNERLLEELLGDEFWSSFTDEEIEEILEYVLDEEME